MESLMHHISTLLIIENDPELLDLISKTLEQRYHILKTNKPDNVLDILSENAVDLILSNQPLVRIMLHGSKNPSTKAPQVLLTTHTEIRSFIRMFQETTPEKNILSILTEKEVAGIMMDVLHGHLTCQLNKNEKYKAMLEKADRMAAFGELLPGIVHEIGNPLSFISSNLFNSKKMITKLLSFIDDFEALPMSDIIKTTIGDHKKAINYDYLKNRLLEIVERSQSGAARVRSILDDVRRLSKSTNSEEFVKSDINRAIETTLNIMQNEFNKRITVEKNLGELPEIECHIGQINQVLMNILINAGHAIEKNGRIVIVTRLLPARRISIEISDSGKGIAEADMERIFEPFFTTKPENIGTGLGLSISHDIIKKHHGEIQIVSQPGTGTTVTVTLPVTH